jgi:hypothetical protein
MKSWKPRQPRDSGRKKTNPRSDWFSIRGGGVGPSTTTRFINSWVTVGKDEGIWPLLGLSLLRRATTPTSPLDYSPYGFLRNTEEIPLKGSGMQNFPLASLTTQGLCINSHENKPSIARRTTINLLTVKRVKRAGPIIGPA